MIRLDSKIYIFMFQLIISLAALCATTVAMATNWTLNADSQTWANLGAATGDNVDLNGYSFYIQTAATTGNITDSSGTPGTLYLTASGSNLTAALNSINTNGGHVIAGNDNGSNTTDSVNLTVSNALTTGSFLLFNNAGTASPTVAMSVGGNFAVSGSTTLQAGTYNGATTTLTLAGTSISTGSFIFENSQSATLIFNGTSTQSITGTMSGAGNNVSVLVESGSTATFNNPISGLNTFNVDATAANTTAILTDNLSASSMTLGN